MSRWARTGREPFVREWLKMGDSYDYRTAAYVSFPANRVIGKKRLDNALGEFLSAVDHWNRAVAENEGLPEPKPQSSQNFDDIYALLTSGSRPHDRLRHIANLVDAAGGVLTSLDRNDQKYDAQVIVTRSFPDDETIILDSEDVFHITTWQAFVQRAAKQGRDMTRPR